MCKSHGLQVYPYLNEIKPNSIFMLEGYAQSQKVIDSLGSKYPIYLRAGSEIVSLIVQETLQSMFSLTQAILKPESLLSPGKTYSLHIDNLDEVDARTLSKFRDYSNPDSLRWTVVYESDTLAPEWIKMPKLKERSYESYGCGPGIHAGFDLKLHNGGHCLLKTELFNRRTGTINTYYVIGMSTKRTYIGHGMCSGAFRFANDKLFSVRFTVIDDCGNVNPKSSKWIKFRAPKRRRFGYRIRQLRYITRFASNSYRKPISTSYVKQSC